jgi:hypothetical protein
LTDDEKRELRRVSDALAQVLAMCSIPKKAESFLSQIHARLVHVYDPKPPPLPMWKMSVAELEEHEQKKTH